MWLGRFDGPGERSARRVSENAEFENLRDKLQAVYSPSLMYRAMLYRYRRLGKKDGNAHHAFVDLYGSGERNGDHGDPIFLNDPDFDRWMQLRDLRNRRAWQRLKAKERRK